MMSEIKATVNPDLVLRNVDINLGVYGPLAGLWYKFVLHATGWQVEKQTIVEADIESDKSKRRSHKFGSRKKINQIL